MFQGNVPGQHYNVNWATGTYKIEPAADVSIPVIDLHMGSIRIEGVGADLAARIGKGIWFQCPSGICYSCAY